MKKMLQIIVASSVFMLLALHAGAEDATKLDWVGEGAVDAVTSPGKIADGIADGTQEHGVVVGTVTGTAQAVGQAVKGVANVGVGAVETILSPVTGD